MSSRNESTILGKSALDLASIPVSEHIEVKLPINKQLPRLLFVTSYPPRECGIATYSEDLIKALNSKFENSFEIQICAIENNTEQNEYPQEVTLKLNTQIPTSFENLAVNINNDQLIELVIVQHEFGFFHEQKELFIKLLSQINKTKITVFHTVLPKVDEAFKQNVKDIAENSDALIVMTNNARSILCNEYQIAYEKISVIAHGTHLVEHVDKEILKEKYGFENRKILSTFGLLSSGKSIETTLNALPDIIKTKPDVLFLIIGKTHPGVVKEEGEIYRASLEVKVAELGLQNNVQFVNKYVSLEVLLEYLQLTDIYLFTSKDPNQAVSGTFSYAASCGCAIVSTPIPHAVEFLSGDSGIVIDFQNSKQLSEAVNKLLFDVILRRTVKMNGLHKIVATAWENSAIKHALLFENATGGKITAHHRKPEINLNHIKRMTTTFGMIQFAKMNQPDIESGYTIDDNARALIAIGEHYALTGDRSDLKYIQIYLSFIEFCQQPDGSFLNYVNYKRIFTNENLDCNLDDANGRAIWALGYLISISDTLPDSIVTRAEDVLEKAMITIENIHSPRSMAFIIKGLYYYNTINQSKAVRLLVKKLANKLTQMYLHEESKEWQWFESYLTYANSILPEALLLAYKETSEITYKEVAKKTFDFLLSQTFNEKLEIKVISNRNWFQKGGERAAFGEQPIDVAYTILALNTFYNVFKNESYKTKIETAFEWFLGRNHLNQVIYNPCTGGCYDGLEETSVNLNQGAESSVSYLLARLCMDEDKKPAGKHFISGLKKTPIMRF